MSRFAHIAARKITEHEYPAGSGIWDAGDWSRTDWSRTDCYEHCVTVLEELQARSLDPKYQWEVFVAGVFSGVVLTAIAYTIKVLTHG